MPDNSFDIVSEVSMPEVVNSIQNTLKEVHQRYDLKNSPFVHEAWLDK